MGFLYEGSHCFAFTLSAPHPWKLPLGHAPGLWLLQYYQDMNPHDPLGECIRQCNRADQWRSVYNRYSATIAVRCCMSISPNKNSHHIVLIPLMIEILHHLAYICISIILSDFLCFCTSGLYNVMQDFYHHKYCCMWYGTQFMFSVLWLSSFTSTLQQCT